MKWVPSSNPHVVNSGDVRVIEGGGGSGFLLEACQAVWVGGQSVGENFDGNRPSKNGVLSTPNYAHAAFADLLDKAVMGKLLASFNRHGCVVSCPWYISISYKRLPRT